MTASLPNNSNVPFGFQIDGFVYPQFIGYALRAPTTQDIYNPGTRWQDNSQNPAIIYETTGAGLWISGSGNQATTTVYGSVILTDNSEPVATKLYADNLAIAGAPDATPTTKGISFLATNADVVSPFGTPLGANTVLTPANIVTIFASPPASGSTTPAAGKFTTLEATGLFSGDAGATINTAGTPLNLGADADTAAINIGIGASGRIITIGNVSSTTSLVLNSGTGGIALASTTTGDITLASADTLLLDSAGVLELNSSAGVISIGNDVVTQNINIGTGGTRAIAIGNSTSTTSVSLNGGTGSSINIGTNAIQHAVTIGNVTGNTAVTIDSGTGAINIGTSIAKIITIGNVTGATQLIQHVGTAGYTLDGVTNSTYNIGASTTSGTIVIGGTSQTGATAITLGSSSQTSTVIIQGGAGASTTLIGGGTGAANITSINTSATGQSSTINLMTGAMTAGTHAVNILTGNSSGGTETFNLSTGTGAAAINIGTGITGVKTIQIGGTAANVITIGNTQTTGSVAIGNALTSGTISLGGTAGTGTITVGGATNATGQIISIQSGASIAGPNEVDILAGATPAANQTLNIMTGAGTAGTYQFNVLTGNSTGTTQSVSIATGSAVTTIAIGGTGANVVSIANTQTGGSLSLAHAMTTGNIVIGDAQTSGTLTIGSTAGGIGDVRIADGTGAQIVKIATGAGGKTVTLGSTNTTSTLTLNSGTGNINATGGNLKIATTGKGLQIKSGAVTDMAGTAILVLGTLLVANTNIATGDLIFLSRVSSNGSVTLGELTYTISNGASFTITSLILGTPASTQVADVSSVAYFIVRPV